MNLEWLCYHIYYQADFNHLLEYCIHPLLINLEHKKLIHGYFFLRYWKNGPHLRLRIKIDHKNHIAIKHCLEQSIMEHLKQHPSKTIIDEHSYYENIKSFAELENESLTELTCMENNSLHQTHYHPELHKYGGPIGTQIAEEIFIVSSTLAMNICIRKMNKFVYGIAMMFFAVKSFELSLTEMQRFFQAYYQYWRRYQPDEYTKPRLQQFDNYERLRRLFYNIQSGHVVSGLKSWPLSLHSAYHQLTQHLEKITTHLADSNAQKYPLQYLLTQYIHTNNNRLGVLVTEEALLGYLAMSIVQQVIVEKNNHGIQ